MGIFKTLKDSFLFPLGNWDQKKEKLKTSKTNFDGLAQFQRSAHACHYTASILICLLAFGLVFCLQMGNLPASKNHLSKTSYSLTAHLTLYLTSNSWQWEVFFQRCFSRRDATSRCKGSKFETGLQQTNTSYLRTTRAPKQAPEW